MLNSDYIGARLWNSHPRFDEFDESCDFVLGKPRHIKVALPLSNENLHRQAGEFI